MPETDVFAGGKIDTHCHLFPPRWLAEHGQDIVKSAPGIAASVTLDWTPQVALDAMDKFGIATSVLSIPTPGVWFGDVEKSRSLARHCNEFGARLVQDRPDRFGMFAIVSFNDVDGTLREIEYALDVLKLDGIGMMTSCEGKYPGDPSCAAIFDELNRRKAVVYFHPLCPPFALNVVPGVSPAIGEFIFDTTRAVLSLLYSGTLSRCADVKFIFSHGGGTVPYLADRIASLARRPTEKEMAARIPKGVMYELGKLYYDIVSICGNPPGMACLRGIADPTHLLFGTDFPYYRMEHSAENLPKSAADERELAAINRRNALALFPRLRKN
jgi:predicted TIM-barrel fold metal-dependent hydrolase